MKRNELNRRLFGAAVVVTGNRYVEMKTPDVHGPSQSFVNPDYFNQAQHHQQQQQQQQAAGRDAARPTEYCNVQRR